MNEPLPRFDRGPHNIVPLSRTHTHGVGLIAGRRGQGDAINGDDLKWSAMNMHRVDEAVVGADKAHLQGFTHLHVNGLGCRIGLSVDREVIRLSSIHGHRGEGEPLAHEPFLQFDHIFMVGGDFVGPIGGIDDERAIKSKRLRAIGVRVGMIKIGAVLLDREFVIERFTRLDRFLRDLGGTVPRVRNNQTVPVNGGRLRQFVVNDDANMVALADVDARSRNLFVVRIGIQRS